MFDVQIRNFLVIAKLFTNARLFTIYEVNCQIGHGKWFTIASRFLLPSLTVIYLEYYFFTDFGSGEGELLTNINCVVHSIKQPILNFKFVVTQFYEFCQIKLVY